MSDEINKVDEIEAPGPVARPSDVPTRPAPISRNPQVIERTVVTKNPGLPDSSAITDGQSVRYTKEIGVDLPPFDSRNSRVHRHRGLELRPGQSYVVGEDIPAPLAQRLFERGVVESA